MKTTLIILAIVAMACTVLATLTAVVFCAGMGANAKPPEIRSLKLWMVGLTLLGVAGITAGIVLLRANQPGWAVGVSLAPSIIMIGILVISLLRPS